MVVKTEKAIMGSACFLDLVILKATRLDQNSPIAKTIICSSKLNDVDCPTQGFATAPSKFQPHPSGSEITGKTYENFASAKEIVKAIQAIKPNGTRTWL